MIYCTYANNDETIYLYSFNKINNESIIKIVCAYNQLTHLPENMNFQNLTDFICSHNQLTHLPENMNFPNLMGYLQVEKNILITYNN